MRLCEWNCGRIATHFCSGCGKWICSSPGCLAKSTAAAVRKAAAYVLPGGKKNASHSES